MLRFSRQICSLFMVQKVTYFNILRQKLPTNKNPWEPRPLEASYAGILAPVVKVCIFRLETFLPILEIRFCIFTLLEAEATFLVNLVSVLRNNLTRFPPPCDTSGQISRNLEKLSQHDCSFYTPHLCELFLPLLSCLLIWDCCILCDSVCSGLEDYVNLMGRAEKPRLLCHCTNYTVG